MNAPSKAPAVAIVALFIAGITIGYGAWQTLTQPQNTIQTPSPVDIGFAQFMSIHHQQAISMAQIMLTGPETTPLKRMAQTIAYTQLRELGKMEAWLRIWGENSFPPSKSMGWMLLGKEPPSDALLQYLIDCENSPTGMTGLATVAELDELRRLNGKAKDRQFLQLMLAHHKGGLPMAEFAAQNADVDAVRELAALMAREQAEELLHMHRALAVIASTSP
jgi:uncharacterized protein (DUF305 family)